LFSTSSSHVQESKNERLRSKRGEHIRSGTHSHTHTLTHTNKTFLFSHYQEYTEGDVHRESFYQPPIEDEDEDDDDDDIEMTHVVSNTSAQLAYNLALARTAAAAPGTAPASSAAAALPAKPHQDDHEDTEAPPAYSELNEGSGVGGRASGQGLQIEIHSRPTAMREYPHFDSPYGAESPSGLPLIFPDNNNTIPRRGQGTVAVVRRGDHEAADLCDADIYAIMGDLPGVTEEAALTVPGLRDPKVRKQLKNQRKYRFPYFLIAVTLVQCAMLIAEFVTYHNATGQVIFFSWQLFNKKKSLAYRPKPVQLHDRSGHLHHRSFGCLVPPVRIFDEPSVRPKRPLSGRVPE